MIRPINFNAEEIRSLIAGTKIIHSMFDKSNTRRGGLFPDANLGQKLKNGDLLWVREAIDIVDAGISPSDHRYGFNVVYDADGQSRWLGTDNILQYIGVKSPIQMPRFASRITLHLKDVNYLDNSRAVDLKFIVMLCNVGELSK